MSLTVLMGCSADSEPETSEMKTAAVEVVSFVTGYDEAYGANRAHEANGANGAHRAWAIPSGYVAYEGGEQSIGIAFTQNNVEPRIGSFFKSGDKWRTNINDIPAGTYQLYGYIPHQTAINYSITDYDGAEGPNGAIGSYSTGAIMTLQNVPTVMPNDLCVVIGAKHGYDREHDGNNDGTNRLRMGDFSFTAKQGTDSKDYVFLLFDHLYAALRVQMRVQGDYATRRTIKLKKLRLQANVGNTPTTKKTSITITLNKTTDGTNPITNVAFTPTGTEISDGVIVESKDGIELTTDFQPFQSHFMPAGVTKLNLISTYDVYDRKGNLIRLNDEAINTIDIKELFSGQTQALRGRRYTINMTINPTYLYMLSEPDLDNPTVTIN